MKKRVLSSTLVETIVSTLILLIAYSFFLIVILFHSKTSSSGQIYIANNKIDQIFEEAMTNNLLNNQRIKFGSLILEKKVVQIKGDTNGYTILVNAYRLDGLFLFKREINFYIVDRL